jgi:hypothetical protein
MIHVERYVRLFESFVDPAGILPGLTGIQYFGRCWSAQKIARQPGHGEYGNTNYAKRHIAEKKPRPRNKTQPILR